MGGRLVAKLASFEDFLDVAEEVERVYYVEDGGRLLALAGNVVWEGDLSAQPERARSRWSLIKSAKGVRVERFLSLGAAVRRRARARRF
jgi:hypothetical protein